KGSPQGARAARPAGRLVGTACGPYFHSRRPFVEIPMPAQHHSRVLIIGSGPAGYTAAIYAARASLAPILVQGLQPGGQMTITTPPGGEYDRALADPSRGPWRREKMQNAAERAGPRLITDTITAVDLTQRPFRCEGDSGDVYLGDALIICTGAQARWLDLPS